MDKVYNILHLNGDEETVNEAISFISNNDEAIDFNAILPLEDIEAASASWGTKWNALDTERHDDRTITFSTAWSPATPVIVAISKQFPSIELTYQFDDSSCPCAPLNTQIIRGGKVWYDRWAIEDKENESKN